MAQPAVKKTTPEAPKPKHVDDLRALNLKLWEQVHSLELKIRLENNNRKREEKQFRKKLVRLSKYLDLTNTTPKKLRQSL